jgi:hypothetical protein
MKFKEVGTEGIKRYTEDKANTRARMIWLLLHSLPPSPSLELTIPLYPRQLSEAGWQPSHLSCLMYLLSFKGRDFACISTVGGEGGGVHGVNPKTAKILDYFTVFYCTVQLIKIVFTAVLT